MAKLPDFSTEEELIEWFDAHNTAEYMDEMDLADWEFPVILTRRPTRHND